MSVKRTKPKIRCKCETVQTKDIDNKRFGLYCVRCGRLVEAGVRE